VASYTEKEVIKMTDVYCDNPGLETVARLATMFNRPKKSIISKLVKEGVYIKRGYRSKRGEIPITKLQIVRSIEDALDIKLPGLDKAPKGTLKALSKGVLEVAELVEEALDNLKDAVETDNTQREMLSLLDK